MLPAVADLRWARTLALAVALAGFMLLAGCGGSDTPPPAKLSAAAVRDALAKDPSAPLTPQAKTLEAQAGKTIDGGDDPEKTLESILRELRGTPVVVNIWAHWCKPCKVEMPILQRVALGRRGEVAFLGIASSAPRSRNIDYLKTEIALPYPSLLDDDGKIVAETGVDGVPKTLFYDRAGKRTVHNGPYETEADLVADIARYAK